MVQEVNDESTMDQFGRLDLLIGSLVDKYPRFFLNCMIMIGRAHPERHIVIYYLLHHP